MKIIQINTISESGSTGRTTKELSNILIEKGHQSYIAYGQGTSSLKNSFKIGSKIENHIHNISSRIYGKQGYYTKKGTLQLIIYLKKINPDIIHLRNLHGNYINIEILFNYLAKLNIPIIWSLHDCWAFTGKCTHYSDISCYKWKTSCNNCPQIKNYPPSIFIDKSKEMFIDKKRLFTSVKNMTIVPVSKWLANEVKQSFLSKYNIKPIYNWIDHTVFKPTHDNTIKSKYKVNKNNFLILGISAGWNNNEKLKTFIELSKIISNDVSILLIGKLKGNFKLPANISHFDYIESTKELAKIYTISDVYLHTSTEDTFGKVIVESMSCGTPVIAYDSTVYPEIINSNCGFIVKKHDVAEIMKSIVKIKTNKKSFYSNNCIKHVEENFDINKNINQILELYKILNND